MESKMMEIMGPSSPIGKFNAVSMIGMARYQALTLVHFPAQPEPFLSLKPPSVTHEKC
jgi:hypothetical protein